jgi:hypothetical protein
LNASIAELPKLDTSREIPNDPSLQPIIECLQKPSGRLIVDAKTASEVEQILAERYHLQVDRAVSFKGFLKSNSEIVVLKSRLADQAQAANPRLSR